MGSLLFWQGLATDFLAGLFPKWLAASLLAVIVIGFVVFYLKKRNSDLASQILYGLAALCFGIVSLCALIFMAALLKETPQVTPENVGEHIRTWLDHYELRTQKISDPDSYFAYAVTTKYGRVVSVMRTKDFAGYITLQANLGMGKKTKDVLTTLKSEQRTRLISEIASEMARIKMSFVIVPPFEGIKLAKRIPITNNLTEHMFVEQISDMDFALIVASDILLFGLNRLQEKNGLQ